MTGGSEEGYRVNRDLVQIAQNTGIPFGMGSIRPLLEREDLLDQFHFKKFAPDIPIMANLGAAQLRQLPFEGIFETIRRIEVDAIVVHLNVGQELYQPDGDRNFLGIREALYRFTEVSPVPVIVKETGFGIAPSLIVDLLKNGVAYVDIAGSGGTNWISVESYRLDDEASFTSAREFEDWGFPTALVLGALKKSDLNRERENSILSSGGVRSGMDIAKSVALGAHMAGMALPFVRAHADGGREAVEALIQSIAFTLRSVMVLTSSRTIAELNQTPLRYDYSYKKDVESLLQADLEG